MRVLVASKKLVYPVSNEKIIRPEQNIVDIYVGRRLNVLRKKSGLSQRDLSERLGITFQQIQKYEKGLNRLPASRMLAVCMALDITPNDLFHDLLTKEYPFKEIDSFSSEEEELIQTVRQLNPTLQNQVRQIVGTLASQ